MWGQGELKRQDIITWSHDYMIPAIQGENFKIVIFAMKSFLSMQRLAGDSLELFSSFFEYLYGKKTNLNILPMDIFDAFGIYESHC